MFTYMLTSLYEGSDILSNGIRRLPGRRISGCPICEQAQKVAWVMELIEDLEVVPVKYFKKMIGTDDIWEIRIQSGNNIFRILGFVEANNLVVLNHAFQKKTQKTPKKEIAIAEARKKDHLLRVNRYE